MGRLMSKKDEKIVKSAEEAIKKFAEDWSKNPYIWDTEADVHAELYKRIYKRLKRLGGVMKERYKEWDSCENFSSVYCKPLVHRRIKGNKSDRIHPDIVIYKKTKPLSLKELDKNKQNEPMLWVCEIKYSTEWGSQFLSENIKKDIRKLDGLYKQRKDKAINGADNVHLLILERLKRPEMLNKKYKRQLFQKPRNTHFGKISGETNHKVKIDYYLVDHCLHKDGKIGKVKKEEKEHIKEHAEYCKYKECGAKKYLEAEKIIK